MNSSEKDYISLYRLQNKFLSWWVSLRLPFYLTGGTALGRFYLNHRHSDDLDFFMNAGANYAACIAEIMRKINGRFAVNIQQCLFADDFTRIFLTEDEISLKIELVNDVDHYAGKPLDYRFGQIDTPFNILANKLSALIGRDEPKDVFDIIHISLNYSFQWPDIFYHTKQKAAINELDVEQRLSTFMVEWFENVNWHKEPLNLDAARNSLNQLANDFLLGKANSLGAHRPHIQTANPL